ncbi:MAG: hypothetical protein P8M72_01820 [Gammaproteobacteria bacterium]|nr:hypothetical protein [Gammaproteobacteria bacterium]
MAQSNSGIAVKATALVENHSFFATVLAVLCLLFAVNYYLTGPGSDGGSGLGGTGKYGESGLGGTGKTPDNGSGFKLGAADDRSTENNNDSNTDYLDSLPFALDIESVILLTENSTSSERNPFNVNALRLTPQSLSQDLTSEAKQVSAMIVAITLDQNPEQLAFDNLLTINNTLSSDVLISSMDILNSLMIAEAENSLRLAAAEGVDSVQIADANIKAMIRTRLAVPVRPERPDRVSIPIRITPVQRIGLPSPPPVRPMRTLSTLLNR